jgi:hypothetical protein
MKSYRELDVWKKAMDMVVAVYELTSKGSSSHSAAGPVLGERTDPIKHGWH